MQPPRMARRTDPSYEADGRGRMLPLQAGCPVTFSRQPPLSLGATWRSCKRWCWPSGSISWCSSKLQCWACCRHWMAGSARQYYFSTARQYYFSTA